jgi:hypothetical protein
MQIIFANISVEITFLSSYEEVDRYTILMETGIVTKSRTRSLGRSC